MSLTIQNDVTTEETRSSAVYASGTNAVSSATYAASPVHTAVASALSGLGVSPYSGPGSITQYAEKTNFVASSNVVSDYFLSNPAGNPLAGAPTSIYVGGNEVFLYSTADSNVVVGLIGNGTTANAAGAVAMVIALDETMSGGLVTSANLWIGLYAPLVHSGLNLEGSSDELNLSGLISLGSHYNTSTQVPFNNFNGVPSGNDAFALIGPSDSSTGVDLLTTGFSGNTEGTVNVSTTGLGANAQTVDNGASLRIDIVNANSADFAKADTGPEVHDAANISYQNHVQSIGAGFQLTQNNPTTKAASLTIKAYEVGADNKGTSFVTNVFGDGTQVRIDPTQVSIHDANGVDVTSLFASKITQSVDGLSVQIVGLPALYHVDFVATSQFDRFVVNNNMTSPTDKTTFDVGGIHVTTIVGGSSTEYADLGAHTIFEDDGPVIAASGTAPPTLTVHDATLGTDAHTSFASLFTAPDYGADGAGTVTYSLAVKNNGTDVVSGLYDTLTGQSIVLNYDAISKTVIGTTIASHDTVFTISVNSSGDVNLDQARAIKHPTSSTTETLGLSASDLVSLTATITDGEASSHNDSASASVNIGASLVFTDDGPTLTPQAVPDDNNLLLGNVMSATDSSSYVLLPGGDGIGAYTIVGPADSSGDFQWHYNGSDSSIIETYKGTNLFELDLDPATGTYLATMLGTIASTPLPLDANNIKAGGPTGSIEVGTIGTPEYVLITGSSAVNASNANVGVSNGNLDPGESLTFKLYTDLSNTTLIPIHGMDIGTKSAGSATYTVTGVDHTTHQTVTLLSNYTVPKNGTLHVDYGSGFLDSISVTETAGSAIKIGLSGITLLTPPGDYTLGFGVQLTDGDGDLTTQNFTVSIDGNNDGAITNAISAAAVVNTSASLVSLNDSPTFIHHHDYFLM